MKQSDSIVKLMPDLVKAQSEMGSAKKSEANPYFKSKYADLGAVIEVCKDLLNKNNIVYLQPIIDGSVQTILIHSSGEWIADEGTKIICKNESDPQSQGSAITYARRYGLQSFLGIPAEDDDGEKATEHKAQTAKPVTQNINPVANEDISPQCSQCMDVITESVLNWSQKNFGVPLCFNCQQLRKKV